MEKAAKRKKRWPRIAAAAMLLTAIVSWVLLLDEGVSSARVLAAVFTTIGSVLSVWRLWKEERGGTEREV